MPCWTIQVNSVKVEAMDHDLMVDALKSMGVEHIQGNIFLYQGQRYEVRGGELISTAPTSTIERVASELKASYSEQVVLYTAERTGFTAVKTAHRRYKLVKRRY